MRDVVFRKRINRVLCLLVLVFLTLGVAYIAYADTVGVSISVLLFECNDGIDNDFDGLTDFPSDPGCTGAGDNDETDPQCLDGIDNDLDGFTDYPSDPGCSDANDNDETDIVIPPPLPPPVGGGGGSYRRSRDIRPRADFVTFGGLAHPLGNVTLLVDGRIVVERQVDGSANFNIELRGMTPGQYVFTLYGVDTEGVRSGLLSFATEIVESAFTDITGIFIPPTLHAPRLSGQGDVLFTGYTVPKARVSLSLQTQAVSRPISILANDAGLYRYALATALLGVGDHSVRPSAEASGQKSPFGRAVQFVPDRLGRVPGLLRGDLNGDRRVNLVDFSMIVFWQGKPNPPLRFDLNGDGNVTLADFSIMAFYWTG